MKDLGKVVWLTSLGLIINHRKLVVKATVIRQIDSELISVKSEGIVDFGGNWSIGKSAFFSQEQAVTVGKRIAAARLIELAEMHARDVEKIVSVL